MAMTLDEYIRKLQKKQERYKQPISDPVMRHTGVVIGETLKNTAKLTALRKGIKDSGNLINHIEYELKENSRGMQIILGVSGTVYARINEYGGRFTENMRKAMFAKFAELNKKRRSGKEDNNVIIADTWRARPYLRPAILENREKILKYLRKTFGES